MPEQFTKEELTVAMAEYYRRFAERPDDFADHPNTDYEVAGKHAADYIADIMKEQESAADA